LLQCHHFADTSVLAETAGSPLGFISGYLLPDSPDTLFVWQVAVDADARGQGLGSRMLGELMDRVECAAVTHMETTVTPSNQASRAMFNRFAAGRGALVTESELFSAREHFAGRHESEILLRIGPF
jgi:L-2,4-diaminobutyric acid acetyltransferase